MVYWKKAMKKTILTLLPLYCCLFTSQAQTGIQGMIRAEKNFAAYTEAQDVQQGFLKYLDSAGIVFENGEPRNGISVYRKRAANPGLLTWEPELAVISAGGDFGFTTGPYEFRLGGRNDTPAARGNYASIWQLNKKGEWKFLNDIGINYSSPHAPVKQVEAINIASLNASPITYEGMLATDRILNTAVAQKNIAGFLPYLTANTWFNVSGQQPARGPDQIKASFKTVPGTLIVQHQGGQLARAKDMGYVYGKITNGKKVTNYMRVWMRSNNRWVLLLQVLNW